MNGIAARISALGALLAALAWGSASRAQMMGPGGVDPSMGPGMGPSMGGGRPRSQPPPSSKEPVTHAAPGASDDEMHLGGTEPTLPIDPLKVTKEQKARIGTDADPDREKGRAATTHRTFFPPYYEETSGAYGFKTVFPFWFERSQPQDRASLYGMLYFNRRSPQRDADIVFPLFFHLRNGDRKTTVVGPVMHTEAPGEHENWTAPLYFSGSGPDWSYLHIPPLLTFSSRSTEKGFNIFGPWYCFWKDGNGCGWNKSTDVDMGLAPLFFAGKNDRWRYEIVPPLLHYFQYDEVQDWSANIWGPLVWKHTETSDAFDVLPLFFHNWGKNEDHLTVFPFFHYGYKGTSSLFVNPLFLTARGEKGESTFVTWGYARYRGRTELDMVTPLFWSYRDPDIGLSRIVVPPIFYHSSSPRGYDTGLFPLFLRSKRYDLTDTTFITPFFQHTHDLQGWQTNIHPIFYLGRTNQSTHMVIAPLFWDFASPTARTTVVLPLFWRFADQDGVSELVGNTFYRERHLSSGLDWEFHFFPAFSYGETPGGHWWNVLYGLAGYTRDGAMTKMRALWIPITLSGGSSEPE
jgi:hypothetical protein